VEVLKTRSSNNILGYVSQNISDRFGSIEDVGVGGKVYREGLVSIALFSRFELMMMVQVGYSRARTVDSDKCHLHGEEAGVCISKKMLSPLEEGLWLAAR